MTLRAQPSGSTTERKQNAASTTKKRVYSRKTRASFAQWCENFDARAADWQATAKLHEWSLLGLPRDFIRIALFLYYCGPNQEAVSSGLANLVGPASLPRRMKDIAGDLDQAISQMGESFLTTLDKINSLIPPQVRIPDNLKPSELAKHQSKLLRLMAAIFKIQFNNTNKLVAGRKLAATRVLVWLYWGLKTVLEGSNNKTYSQLANLLEMANEASGGHAIASNELQIRQRIARFKKDHYEEFTWIEEYWRKREGPPEPNEFFTVMTFGPAYPRGG